MNDIKERYEHWLNHPNLGPELRAELLALDSDEIADRFYRNLTFGTGGMRGVMGAGTNRLNIPIVRRVAYGLACYLREETKNAELGVVVAYDTRRLSLDFACEVALTLQGLGIDARFFYVPVPTPALSFAVAHLHAAAGVMITASHNPAQYNGIKVYDEFGVQLTPPKAGALTACIQRQPDALELTANRANFQVLDGKVIEDYIDAVLTQALPVCGKQRISIVYTPIHGTGLMPVNTTLRMDGFMDVTLVTEQCEPDGAFPTVASPNPEERCALEMGIKRAESLEADLVFGTDPDADRLGVAVRHNGEYRLLSGNQIGALLVWFVLEKRKDSLRPGDTIVKTIVTGELGAKIAESYGVQVVNTLTGFKYIGEASVQFEKSGDRSFLMGYEESYGYLVGTHARDKDAVVSAMLMAELAAEAKNRGETLIDILNDLYARYGTYSDALTTITMPGERGMYEISAAMERFRQAGIGAMPEPCTLSDYQNGIDGLPKEDVLRFLFSDGSWMAVRPSGTEPKLKLYFSVRGETSAAADDRLNEIREAALKRIKTDAEATK